MELKYTSLAREIYIYIYHPLSIYCMEYKSLEVVSRRSEANDVEILLIDITFLSLTWSKTWYLMS